MKVNDENSGIRIQDPDPDPQVGVMDPRIRIRIHPQNVMDPQHWLAVSQIRIGFNTNPETAFYVTADSDPNPVVFWKKLLLKLN